YYDEQNGIDEITTLQAMTTQNARYNDNYIGTAPIKRGSKMEKSLKNDNIMAVFSLNPDDLKDRIINSMGIVKNPDGSIEFKGNEWMRGGDHLARAEAQKQAERKKAEEPIYNAYCTKYGKRYVDAVLNGKMVIGMPLSLIKEVLDCHKTNDYGAAQWYNVVIEKPHYDFDNKKLAPDEIHSVFSSRASILIRNGRVAAINYR
ncbi:MAG: hypothetical protein K2L93_03400, partial [Muribaculaceae bacterium]|nr:hypothetical protein [Muribaculaceae bacterium]